jgi:DnaK suppressor protein
MDVPEIPTGGVSNMTTLNSQQTRQLETRLLALRRGVLTEAHDELAHATEHSYAAIAGEVPDFGDQATAAALADFENVVARRHVEVIREIDAALLRIKARGFGKCAECGADIGFARLRAFPAARRCVPCQTLHERTFAGSATTTM